MCGQQSLRSACACAQYDQSRCLLHEYSMSVRLLTEHDLEFLSLKVGCTGSSESTLVKMSRWNSHFTAQIYTKMQCRLNFCDRDITLSFDILDWLFHLLFLLQFQAGRTEIRSTRTDVVKYFQRAPSKVV